MFLESRPPYCATHLVLNIRNHIRLDLILVQRNLSGRQELQETLLARQQEQQTLARLAGSGGPSDSVDVVTRIIRRIELDDPVDFGNVEASSGDICAEEVACRGVAEFEEGVGTLLLLLLALIRGLFRGTSGQIAGE